MKTSPYYPPRAGRRSRLLARMNRLTVGIRQRSPELNAPVVHWAGSYSSVSWLLLPGLMWRQQGRPVLGAGVLAIWLVLLAIDIVSLNTGIAYIAAALVSAIHAISAAAVLTVLYPQWRGFSRLWRTSLLASLLVIAIYSVGLRSVVPAFAQRVTSKGTTVMIHGAYPPWVQGEWVVYRLPTGQVNMDRILAGPGDTLRFHNDSFEVNGRFFERVSDQMPKDGEMVVEGGVYFIWPTGAAYAHGGDQTGLLLRLTRILDSDLLGRPYRRWFWKTPDLEPLKPLSATGQNRISKP
ncbi:MAG: hypothetical protein JWO82_92 [Akkermansiaceae bacterium]|nr:hypothetical protein [Akkermansiaceae bacterium]